jgi:hypothetical protein
MGPGASSVIFNFLALLDVLHECYRWHFGRREEEELLKDPPLARWDGGTPVNHLTDWHCVLQLNHSSIYETVYCDVVMNVHVRTGGISCISTIRTLDHNADCQLAPRGINPFCQMIS